MNAQQDNNSESNTAESIPVRKMNFQFEQDIPKDFINGDIAYSHFFDGLNLLFPEGERFFMRAVRDGLNKIKDPVLAQQARGFFGQETQHAIEHEKYFDILENKGYQFRPQLERFDSLVLWMRNKIPVKMRLAMTAGTEHLTAILGTTTLTDPDMENTHPTMRRLMMWHAVEEIEHKSVAYDVYQEAYGGYFSRVFGYILAMILVMSHADKFTKMFLKQDGYSAKESRKLVAIHRKSMLKKHPGLIKDLLRYLKPGFHPIQIKDRHLLTDAKKFLGVQ